MAIIRNVHIKNTSILRVWKGSTKVFEYNGIDTIKPVITSFVIPSTYYNLTVPITEFIATDNVAVSKYLITETETTPSTSDPNWSVTPQTEYTFSTQGDKTIYAWVIDSSDNISLPVSKSVLIRLAEENTYYVDTRGNNTTGTGAVDNPWASLYKACSTVTTPGSKIHIFKGVYTENNRCPLSLGVSIVGEGKTNTIIKFTYSNTSYLNGCVYLSSPGINNNGNQSISKIGFDGMNYTAHKAIYIGGRGNVEIFDCDFKDFEAAPAFFWGSEINESWGYRNEANHPITWTVGNKFYNNTVSNCSNYSFNGLGLNAQSGFELYNNVISSLRPSGTGGDCVWAHTNKELIFRDNIFERTDYTLPYWNFAFEIRWNYGGCQLYNNEFIRGTADICYSYKEDYNYSWDIHNNIFRSDIESTAISQIGGLSFEAETHTVNIYDNTFKNIAYGLTIIGFAAGNIVEDFYVHNNLFYNIGGINTFFGGSRLNGIEISGKIGATVRNFYIYNNTIIASNSISKSGILLGTSGTIENVNIKNNIIMGFDTAPVFCYLRDVGTSIDLLTVMYNNFYQNGNNNEIKYGFIPSNLTVNNQLTNNPLFVSSTDFNLQGTSPMIDAGVDVGLPFNGTAPDLGAYEHS